MCQQCKNNFFLNNTIECLSICPVGKFASLITKTCDLCDISCKQCSGNKQNECLECKN